MINMEGSWLNAIALYPSISQILLFAIKINVTAELTMKILRLLRSNTEAIELGRKGLLA